MKHLLLSAILLMSAGAFADSWTGKWTGEGMLVSTKHGKIKCQEVLYETTEAEGSLTVHVKKTCGEGEGQVAHEHTSVFAVKDGVLKNADGKEVGTLTHNTIQVSEVTAEGSHNCVAVRTGAHVKLNGSHTHGHSAGHFTAFLTAAE